MFSYPPATLSTFAPGASIAASAGAGAVAGGLPETVSNAISRDRIRTPLTTSSTALSYVVLPGLYVCSPRKTRFFESVILMPAM